ncbi:hypothetical protein SAMN05443247_06527 [Bradyrhizobium erythrophlei]|nr:hypothetical protein SAMN05443247_06527 [Bradyrhizobium erythrophlei]
MPTAKATLKKKPGPVAPVKQIKHQAPVPIPPDAVYVSAKQVLARYGGRSEMWLNRKLIAEVDFPRPMYSGRLRFFRLDELEQYEKLAVVRGRVKMEA